MRTGAIFARGGCRALNWMALVGMVFLLLGAGQASAQTATAMTDTMANNYDRKVAVVEFSKPVWGNVPDGAFAVSGNVVVAVAGLPTSSPGTRTITITFNADLTPGTDNVVYTQPANAARRLMTTDGLDADSDPDEAASPLSAAVIEEPNAPALPDIASFAVMKGETYTAASPAATLPGVTGNSGTDPISSYALAGALPAPLAVNTTIGDADFGKITGGPVTAEDGTVAVVEWTATDSATPTARTATKRFRIEVREVPGKPGTLTATPGDGSVTLSWSAPTTGGAFTGYEYKQDNGAWMSTGGGMATMHEVTGLMNGTTYIFRVRAVNLAGAGMESDAVTAMPTAETVVPGMPGTLTAVAGSGSVTLSWSAPTTGGMVASYEYQQTVDGVPGGWMRVMAAGTTLTVTGLTNGVTYNFQVRARNAAGPGPESNIVNVTPAAGPARGIHSVSLGTINEGGQAQATVTLTGPVPAGQFVRVKLRLVGKLHTRQNTPAGVQIGGPFSATPIRQSVGVRTYLSGELDVADYDANVAGELTIQAGQSSGQVTVYATTDDDAEDEVLLLQAVPDNKMFNRNSDSLPTGGKERLFWIDDSHEQGYSLTAVPSKIYEAGNRATVSTVHFTPNYRRVDNLRMSVTLTSSHSSYSALFANGLNTMALPAGAEGVTAQFQLVPLRTPAAACTCDGDRVDDEVTVNAVIGGEVVATTMITVVDVHKLPEITVTAMTEAGAGPLTELAEGSKYKVKVEANRNKPSGEVTGETVTVTLPLADSSEAMAEDYRLTPSSVSISGSANDQSKTFTLEVLGGDGDIGEEMLVLDAMVKGGSVNGGGTEMKGMLSVTLDDTTTLNVKPKSDVEVELAVTKARNESEGADNLWTTGDDDLSIMLGDLFTLPSTGFNISADAMSADTDVVMASADSTGVTLKAMGPGTAMVTVTATTAATSVSTQVSANIATVAFEVMVDKLDLVLMLSGPEDNMNLVEGDMPHANGTPASAMLTVMANQKVAEDMEVMIMRDRSESTASEDDYEVGMLTIEAGEMSGTTMVMAVEDDMAEDMEELVLYAMAGDMEVDGEVMLYLWDAAVPALPIIAQLLLAGVLGIGGYRRYRRR